MSARKIIEVASFDWAGGTPVPSIVDDWSKRRKVASSSIADKWRDLKPEKGHSLIHLAAMGTFESVGSNQNGDAFEHKFLKIAHPTFVSDAYLFRDHKSYIKLANDRVFEDPSLREGTVVDSALWDEMQRVELLISARHDKCADWLGDIEAGNLVSFSMGFECDYDECSKCSQKTFSPPDGYCEHVRKEASYPYGMNSILSDGSKCFVFNRKGKFKDISKVGIGADMTAFHLRKVAHAAEAGVMGGAELARFYEELHGTGIDPFRSSIFRKLSAAEKQIAGMGVVIGTGDPSEDAVLPPAVANTLSRAGSPKESMSWLADRKVILPPREFFKVAMAGSADPMDCHAVSRKLASRGFSWAQENGLESAVLSNVRWEPGNFGCAKHLPIHSRDEREVVDSMSTSSALRSQAVKVASLKRASIQSSGDLTPGQMSMAVEFLAYKLSAACRLAEEFGEGGAMKAL